jgi:hypothetical protein
MRANRWAAGGAAPLKIGHAPFPLLLVDAWSFCDGLVMQRWESFYDVALKRLVCSGRSSFEVA